MKPVQPFPEKTGDRKTKRNRKRLPSPPKNLAEIPEIAWKDSRSVHSFNHSTCYDRGFHEWGKVEKIYNMHLRKGVIERQRAWFVMCETCSKVHSFHWADRWVVRDA